MSDDAAQIAFVSPHAAVREAIEASLQDLRTALGERGLALGQAFVSADSGQAREQFQEAQARASGGHFSRGTAPAEPLPMEPARARSVGLGRVDLFA